MDAADVRERESCMHAEYQHDLFGLTVKLYNLGYTAKRVKEREDPKFLSPMVVTKEKDQTIISTKKLSR